MWARMSTGGLVVSAKHMVPKPSGAPRRALAPRYASVASVFRQLSEKGFSWDPAHGTAHMHRLTEAHEDALLVSLSRYPEVVEAAALNHEPHLLAHFLRDLANEFHTYYNAHQFLVDDQPLRDARLNLIEAVRQVLANGLLLLGVSAPDSM